MTQFPEVGETASWSEFALDELTTGFAEHNALEGETVSVQTCGLYTSDDGPRIYEILDQLYASIFARGTTLRPDEIRNVFVSIEGKAAKMLVNPPMLAHLMPKRPVEKGQIAYTDDIVDADAITFPGVDLPRRGGLIVVLQHDWRRAVYFDFRDARTPEGAPRRELGNVSGIIASVWNALALRDRVRMDPTVLARMFEKGWFPFVRLPDVPLRDLYRCFEIGWDTAEHERAIRADIEPQLARIVDGWQHKPAFVSHLPVLREAATHYAEGRYRAAASMLWPKVEGILREVYDGASPHPKSHQLRGSFLGHVRSSVTGYTALMPEAFVEYLRSYYGAGFNLKAGQVPPSRNSFAHGVGPDERMLDPIYSLQLFLTLDQIFFCLSRVRESA